MAFTQSCWCSIVSACIRPWHAKADDPPLLFPPCWILVLSSAYVRTLMAPMAWSNASGRSTENLQHGANSARSLSPSLEETCVRKAA